MGVVSSGKEPRFHNSTGHILELAVSKSILDVCALSLSKICLVFVWNLTNSADAATTTKKEAQVTCQRIEVWNLAL